MSKESGRFCYGKASQNTALDNTRIAVVGSGPAGFYFAAYVDNSGGRLRFRGNVSIGKDVRIAELRKHYNAVVLCFGAESDRKLGIEGESSSNWITGRNFVLWYNGHPSGQHVMNDSENSQSMSLLNQNCEHVTVLGHGNVALDVARILLTPVDILRKTDISDHALHALSQSRVKKVSIVGRRGPLDVAFTIKEFRELVNLPNINIPIVGEPSDFLSFDDALIDSLKRPKKRITKLIHDTHKNGLQSNGQGPGWDMTFCRSPVRGIVNEKNRLSHLKFAVNKLVKGENGKTIAEPTDQTETKPTDLVISSVGYRSVRIPELPFDDMAMTVATGESGYNVLDTPGVYACGWCSSGPTGVIATTQLEAKACANIMADDHLPEAEGDIDSVDRLLQSRGVTFTDWSDWKLIEAEEEKLGSGKGKPREKLLSSSDMLKLVGKSSPSSS